MNKLKPCPFCGESNFDEGMQSSGMEPAERKVFICCISCGADGPTITLPLGEYRSNGREHEAWNQRSSSGGE